MPRDSGPTRRLLIDAAELLFVEKGLDVPLGEITRAAGQRNTGAVHYHFGGRDGLLRAILDRHVPVIAARRAELLDEAGRTPLDPSGYARALVLPITELLYGAPADRAYLQISVRLVGDPTSAVAPYLGGDDVLAVVDTAIAALHPPSPDAYRERAFLAVQMVGLLCAQRAARGEVTPRPDAIVRTGELTRAEFESHLTTIITGTLVPPEHP
ncbi:TetR/AcrR family transcriptional regulator [Yinghuangia sp. YIM S09857]|uniref:TetR/AcrR family transcriptional regulator n=1 Tax=Yinghuangia sp. YIM S09857 TaxID=3436929 RepID=UPI003F52E2DE